MGDENEGCVEPVLMLKRTIPAAGLAVLPRTGAIPNLEESDVSPADTFLIAVARGFLPVVQRIREPPCTEQLRSLIRSR